VHVAIVSDIHGNRHAFEAVLEDARSVGADEVWCLGDLVGYGAEPDACVEIARERLAICLAGNHDLAVTGDISIDDFSRGAAISAKWTQGTMRDENKRFLAELKPAGVEGELGLYHASPRDPIWEYVLSDLLADRCFDEADQRVCFIGHSHVALAFTRQNGGPGRAVGAVRDPGQTADIREDAWLLNPGSVGQPRDGDPRAAWLLLDREQGRVEWRRTRYDIEGAAAAIRAAGLPDSLAERLGYGQ
jgi:diadenosine tetraphosphatase ApaH/serine/threonine PP2A family protein phosphatase